MTAKLLSKDYYEKVATVTLPEYAPEDNPEDYIFYKNRLFFFVDGDEDGLIYAERTYLEVTDERLQCQHKKY